MDYHCGRHCDYFVDVIHSIMDMEAEVCILGFHLKRFVDALVNNFITCFIYGGIRVCRQWCEHEGLNK